MAGLSAGVLAADDPLLSNVNAPRPASIASGDGAGPEPSDLPASGESQAHRFPFFDLHPRFLCLLEVELEELGL